jgi:hypothetical protein
VLRCAASRASPAAASGVGPVRPEFDCSLQRGEIGGTTDGRTGKGVSVSSVFRFGRVLRSGCAGHDRIGGRGHLGMLCMFYSLSVFFLVIL